MGGPDIIVRTLSVPTVKVGRGSTTPGVDHWDDRVAVGLAVAGFSNPPCEEVLT